MKLFFAGSALFSAEAATEQTNPIGKTLELMTALQKKITQDGEAEAKTYNDYATYCSTTAMQKHYEIKTSSREKTKLEASVLDTVSQIEHFVSEVDRLISDQAANERKLKDARTVRAKENSEFDASENQLIEVVGMLNKAISILEKEMSEGSSFAQTKDNIQTLHTVIQGLAKVSEAASFLGDADRTQLQAFIQGNNPEDKPTKAYDFHSDGIMRLMEELRDRSEAQLRKERTEEKNEKHNFDMVEVALKTAIEDGKRQLGEEKGELAETKKAKAAAEGKLAVASKSLADSSACLEALQLDCQHRAAEHEATLRGRAEELAVLEKAKTLIQGSTAEGEEQTYSLLQVGSSHTRAHGRARSRMALIGKEVVKRVSKVAMEQKDENVAKLASKIEAVFRFAAADSSDPFKKVKGLIKDMVAKLESEAREEASEKAYCDKQLGVTKIKRSNLEDQTSGLQAELDNAAAQSSMLKDQVRSLAEGLARLAKTQTEMDRLRAATREAYEETAADLNKALEGVRSAISVLNSYYQTEAPSAAAALLQLRMRRAEEDGDLELEDGSDDDADSSTALVQQPTPPVSHEASTAAGGGIIGLLEVIDDDLAKNLAEEETEESDAAGSYERESQANKVSKSLKRSDIKLKTKQAKALDKLISDQTMDLKNLKEEQAAVVEFWEKLQDRCVAQPETYEETKRRREMEIHGLEEAVAILKSEKSFLQHGH